MRKKILFVNGNLAVGGVERALVNLLNSIDSDKYDVDLLLLQPGTDYLDELRENINIIRRDTTKAYGRLIPTIMRAIMKQDYFSLKLRLCLSMGYPSLRIMRSPLGLGRRYDIAISFRPGFCEEIVLNTVVADKKFTWWHHGDFNAGIRCEKLINNWGKFDKIVTVSPGIASQIKKLSDKICYKVAIIPNIIELEKIRTLAGDISPYKNPRKLKIVTVCRLSKEKNLPIIIETARELKKRGVEFEWSIIGDGDMRNILESAIANSGLKTNIIIRGQKANPYPWIKFADMMVHPSKVESFGIVLLEAMALGTPCISVKSLGAIDLIDGVNGLLVDDSVESISAAIYKVQTESAFRKKMRNAGIITVNSYTRSAIASQFEKIISSND